MILSFNQVVLLCSLSGVSIPALPPNHMGNAGLSMTECRHSGGTRADMASQKWLIV